jgi:hypothetical protein
MDESQTYVLVEGPRWADAEFYGKWLLAAAKANALLQEVMKDPCFMKQVDRLMIASAPDFGITATVLLSSQSPPLLPRPARLPTRLNSSRAVMVEMRFFVRTGERYQMVIPTRLNMKKVKAAMLKAYEITSA